MSDGETPAALLAKLQARNRSEVDAFRAVFEAHAVAQRQARTLQERVTALQRQCAELGEGKENAEASLKTVSEAAARGAAAQDQSARITELQAELAASYKQHAESSQQVIAAKDRLAKAEEELKLARETLAAVERERDEAIARGDDLDAALETSRAAAALAAAEAESRLAGRDDALAKAEKLEAENAMLVERLMAIKVQEAEKMNEINDLYEDLKRQKKENELRAMASDLSAASAASMASLAGAETGAFVGQYFPARKRVAIRANAGGTHRVALTPGGDVLATAGDDKVIALWDADTGLATGPARLTGATGALLDADFSSGPDSREGGGSMMLLGAGTDRAVRLWDATSGRVRHTMTGHADKVCAARFNPWESTRAVSCAHDRTVKAWDLNKGFGVASIMCASTARRDDGTARPSSSAATSTGRVACGTCGRNRPGRGPDRGQGARAARHVGGDDALQPVAIRHQQPRQHAQAGRSARRGGGGGADVQGLGVPERQPVGEPVRLAGREARRRGRRRRRGVRVERARRRLASHAPRARRGGGDVRVGTEGAGDGGQKRRRDRLGR